MRKFTSMAQQRRSERLKRDAETRKVINWLDSQKAKRMKIKVGDKVKWAHVFRSINRNCFGHVVNTHVKVMGNPCFLIQECGDNRQTMVSKDKVSKA